jgi:hypothetical protein
MVVVVEAANRELQHLSTPSQKQASTPLLLSTASKHGWNSQRGLTRWNLKYLRESESRI